VALAYLQPLIACESDTPAFLVDEYRRWLGSLLWNFYLLLLAYKQRTEIARSTSPFAEACERLQSFSMSSEAQARLAMLSGLVAAYDTRVELPAFTVTMSSDQSFADRLDDIIEDAHFVEVSTLRRFFGVAQNRQAVVRDIKKLVAFIVRRKRWATNVLSIGSHLALLPNNVSATAAGFAELLPSRQSSPPVFTTRYTYKLPPGTHMRVHRTYWGGTITAGRNIFNFEE